MKQLFKRETHSQQGILHHIVPVAVVVILFAIIGGYFLLRGGHAATQPQLCGNSGSGYCMNNWSNSGVVKMYYGGTTHENFQYFVLANMCNHGMVTNTCPFTHTSFDRIEAADHAYVVQIRYMPTGQCIAGTGIGAILGSCPDNYGKGGSNGSIQILDELRGDCGYDSREGFLINRYASDAIGALAVLQSGGNVGRPLLLNYDGPANTWTCWGKLF